MRDTNVRWLPFLSGLCCLCLTWGALAQPRAMAQVRLATFAADITIPIGHRCMGVLPTKARQIDDPLQAVGIVLLSDQLPVVIVALDWCEVRNEAYDLWRDKLAEVVGTDRQHVMLSALHQHDATVTDNGAQQLLDQVGLPGELFDVDFQTACIEATAQALQTAVATAQPVTHIGTGQALVDGVASNRRVEYADGTVHFDRYSRSEPESWQATSDPGEIDPWLKSISFYNQDQLLATLSAYATHPMSSYGQGGVSADFVGLARRRRQLDTPAALQIYWTGCSGDVTAGKYNDGSLAARGALADRLYQAMTAAQHEAQQPAHRHELKRVEFRCEQLQLPFSDSPPLSQVAMTEVLENHAAKTEDRILAAMGLSSLRRVQRGQPIDVPCLDLGLAQLLVLPGESFVEYQLLAQRMRPDCTVLTAGYGESWTGYIPTESAFDDGFDHGWRWVGRGCESLIHEKLALVMQAKTR